MQLINQTINKYRYILLVICLLLTEINGLQAQKKDTVPLKASISFRIGPALWLSETRFNALLDLFDRYKGVTDELTFFTSATHPPLPLDVFRERMTILKLRMQAARKRGYAAGVNILSTIGHHEENLEYSLQGSYTHVTDIEGRISRGSYCPNDTSFQQYIREVYQLMVRAEPDYIWIDDDVRLAGHMPVSLTCFCDNCLTIFEKESGKKYTRTDLALLSSQGHVLQKLSVRLAWLQHNRNTINRLFSMIEKEVHQLKPAMPLGFMTGDRFFEGYDFDAWAQTLSGANHAEVRWRPGGGYYADNNTAELAGKSHDIGRQVSVLPKDVVVIQSEIENFPYQRLKKAANIVALEAASHIAAGCTGAAFNVLSFYDEPLDEYEPLVAKLHQSRAFFNRMVRSLGRKELSGASVLWDKNSYATININEGKWLSGGNPVIRPEVYETGIPASYNYKNASVIMLNKNSVYSLSDVEIKRLLSKAVYMSAEALQQLNEMGYGALTGFKVVDTASADRIEQFTGHALNGLFAGRERDNRQSFYREPVYSLQKTDSAAESLSRLIDYARLNKGNITMGLFENSLGGRICVAGYYPWNYMGNLSKSSQVKNVFRWLSRESLLGYIASFHKINLWIRTPEKDNLALAFSNASFDPARDVVLMLRTSRTFIRVYDMDGKEQRIASSGSEAPYRKFIIPHIAPWEMVLVVTDPS
jgi:hypothetical protein